MAREQMEGGGKAMKKPIARALTIAPVLSQFLQSLAHFPKFCPGENKKGRASIAEAPP